MPRYALCVEYFGQPFSGWQRQPDRPSVQGAIEAALAKIEKGPHTIAAAGRTDAGVHATHQVAHCDLQKTWTPFRLSEALNYHLKPLPVAITACALVNDRFHARFGASERRYIYRMVVRRAPLTFDAGRMWRVGQKLDVAAMQEAAQHLIGQHDFTTFRSTMCQAQTPVKTLDELTIRADGDAITFHIRARSFLHNQVRSFVGSLERVGAGGWDPLDIKTALDARDRAACGPVSPPDGLYLAGVTYDVDPFAAA